MAKYFLLFTFITFSYTLLAQEEGRMETDRPDQTESPVITKKKYIQAEFGFGVGKFKGTATILHPTALWKYGLSKRFEFRLITEFGTVETPLIIPDGNDIVTGIFPLGFGGKLALWEEKGLLPKTSFIFNLSPSKLASKEFQTDKWTPNFRFTMQHTLSDHVGLGYNFGAEWDGFSDTPSWIYTFAPGFNIGKNWYGYIEAFGAFGKDQIPTHALDAGIAYYFSDNAKIDLSSGVGITEPAEDWYSSIGFSFRFNTSKKK